MSKYLNRKNLFILLGIIFLLIIVILILVNLKNINPSSPVVVGGKGFSEDKYKKLVSDAESSGTNSDEAKKIIFEDLKKQDAAQKIGLKIPAERIDKIKKDYSLDTKGEYGDLRAQSIAIDEIISNKKDLVAFSQKGYVLQYNFGSRIEMAAYSADKPIGYGQEAAYQEDKKYAEAKAGEAYDQLKNNKISIEDAFKAAKNDIKLGLVYNVQSNNSSKLEEVNIPKPTNYTPDEVLDYILSGKVKKGVNEVQVGRFAGDADSSSKKEAYKYIVFSEKDIPNMNAYFEQTLSEINKKSEIK